MTRFRQPELPREEILLFPKMLDEAIEVDHPVRQFDLIMNADAFQSVIDDMKKSYDGLIGRKPYCPSFMVKLYIYGMLKKIRSSRRLEEACWACIDFRWLMCGQTPDHSTIAAFVQMHQEKLKELLGKTVWIALQADLISHRMLGLDGTKVKANASQGSVRNQAHLEARLEEINRAIERLEAEWQENEGREQKLLGTDSLPWIPPTTTERPERLARLEERKSKIHDALKAIEIRAAQATHKVQPVSSTTDPDSRVMKGKKGGKAEPHYNAQVAVDDGIGIIVAAETSDAATDCGKAVPLVEQAEVHCGRKPEAVSADSQYNTGPDLKALEEREVTTYMPDSDGRKAELTDTAKEALAAMHAGRDLTQQQEKALPRKKDSGLSKEVFTYDEDRDEYICPAGARLHRVGRNKKTQSYGEVNRDVYGGCAECATCKYAALCQDKVRGKGRRIYRDEYESHREHLRARMATEEGKAIYNRRSHVAETPFAFILENLGLRQFLRRGRELIDFEWKLACTALNIKKLMQNMPKVAPILVGH